MIRRPLMLDTGPLSGLVHPNIDRSFADWFRAAVSAGHELVIPEIADYELPRKLLHLNFQRSLVRLDSLAVSLSYLAIDTLTMRRAAQMWGDARHRRRRRMRWTAT
jgi:hypothetical protein